MYPTIANHTHNQENRAALLRHANMIRRGCYDEVKEELDREDIETRYQLVITALSSQDVYYTLNA